MCSYDIFVLIPTYTVVLHVYVYIRDNNNNNICFAHKATGKGHAGRRHFRWVYRPTATAATTLRTVQVSYAFILLYG